MRQHRIVVLGGGYTGILVAGQLARRVRTDDASVTLVTGHPIRDERMRWHQLAAGQRYPTVNIEDALKGSDARLRVGHIEGIDLQHRAVRLADGTDVGYDSLVVALGSVIDFGTVPGARDNAYGLTGVESVKAAARRLDDLPDDAPVTVIGGGLTGIELATEVAESHPRLRVSIVSSRAPGDWLSDRAQSYLNAAFDRCGVRRVIGRVQEIEPDAVTLTDGRRLESALTFWAGGFRANPLVAASGLETDELGRAYVDATFRSPAHPEVRVIGDAARVPGRDGEPLKMGCRTGAFMAMVAPAKMAVELAGGEAKPFNGSYFAECISLGRHDALLQWLTPDGMATKHIVTGWPALRMKEYVHWGNRFVVKHPGPYWPVRRVQVHDGAATGGRERVEA